MTCVIARDPHGAFHILSRSRAPGHALLPLSARTVLRRNVHVPTRRWRASLARHPSRGQPLLACSCWQLNGGVDALLLGVDVVVEKVQVEGSLHDTSDPHDQLHVIVLGHVPVDPVEQVKQSVEP